MIAVLAAIASLTVGNLFSTSIQQAAYAQSQNQSQNNSTNNSSAIPLRNLTGSVRVFPTLSQTIQSKANISLTEAVTNAEKAVGPNSHGISAHIGVINGFLVYTVRVMDANNNTHRVIVDAGNGKILSSIQLPFGNALMHPGGRGMLGHHGDRGARLYPHNHGFFSSRGLNGNGPTM